MKQHLKLRVSFPKTESKCYKNVRKKYDISIEFGHHLEIFIDPLREFQLSSIEERKQGF